MRAAFRVHVFHLAPDHVLDDLALRDALLGGIHRADRRAVADDGHGVRDLNDLLEPVRDHDDRNVLLLEFPQQGEEVLAVLLVEGGGRLVQDQQLGVLGKRFGDLHELLAADAQLPQFHARVDVQAHLFQILRRLHRRFVPVDALALHQLVTEEDVLRDAQLRDQGELLIDDGDARKLAFLDRMELHDLAVQDDVALVAAILMNARQDLHQRGLSRAVLADKAVDLSALNGEIHVLKRLDTGKGLGDVFHLKKNFTHNTTSGFLP